MHKERGGVASTSPLFGVIMRIKTIDQSQENSDELGYYDPDNNTVYVASKLDMLNILARDRIVKDPIEELKVLLPKVHLFQFIIVTHELGHYAEKHSWDCSCAFEMESTASSYVFKCIKKEHWDKARVVLNRLLQDYVSEDELYKRLLVAEAIANETSQRNEKKQTSKRRTKKRSRAA